MEQQADNEKSCFKKFVNHPVYHAISIIALAVVFGVILLKQFYDETSNQREKIELEYKKYVENKNKHQNLINDVAQVVINKRSEVKNFEALYLDTLLKRVDTISKSEAFNDSYIETVNLVVQFLRNDFELLKILFNQTKDNEVKKKILNSFLLICEQNKIKMYSLKSSLKKINNHKYIYAIDKYSEEKINLLHDILEFIAKNSYGFNISNDIYIKFLLEYNPSRQIDEKFILKSILRDSFTFFLMHNTLTDRTELEKKLPYKIIKKLFGNDISLDEYRESLIGYIILLTEYKSLNEKIRIFNENIIGDWFMQFKKDIIYLNIIKIDNIKSSKKTSSWQTPKTLTMKLRKSK